MVLDGKMKHVGPSAGPGSGEFGIELSIDQIAEAAGASRLRTVFKQVVDEQLLMASLGMVESLTAAEQAVEEVAARQPVPELLSFLESQGKPFHVAESVAAGDTSDQATPRSPKLPTNEQERLRVVLGGISGLWGDASEHDLAQLACVLQTVRAQRNCTGPASVDDNVCIGGGW
jgi:hypothetical protein